MIGLAGAAACGATLITGFYLLAFDVPMFLGLLFVDAPDPARPGHMKGVSISPAQLGGHIALVVALGALSYCCIRLVMRPKS